MGLFDFAANIGRKLFGKDEEAPAKIQEHLEADNPGISGLGVNFANGVVTLSGQAETSEALEKAILMAGNVKGVTKVVSEGVSAPPLPEDVQYYEIKSGDTLWAVAKKFYGAGNKYTQIFEANREVIKDPDKIFVGQKIRIPKE
jgi:hypothetical protein